MPGTEKSQGTYHIDMPIHQRGTDGSDSIEPNSSFEVSISPHYAWCCIPTIYNPLTQGNDDENWSTSTFSGEDLGQLKSSLSSEFLRDMNKVQNFAMSRINTSSPKKHLYSESLNVRFTDPLVTSLKTR